MKKMICWLQTIWEFDTFWMVWTTLGAVYVAHEYREWKNTKYTQILKCEICGHKSMGKFKNGNPFYKKKSHKITERIS